MNCCSGANTYTFMTMYVSRFRCVEWKSIPEEEKDRLGLTFDKDGEFWMSYQDFVKNFDSLEICLLNSDDLLEELQANEPKKWEVNVFEGEWVRGVTAGGCLNSLSEWLLIGVVIRSHCLEYLMYETFFYRDFSP